MTISTVEELDENQISRHFVIPHRQENDRSHAIADTVADPQLVLVVAPGGNIWFLEICRLGSRSGL